MSERVKQIKQAQRESFLLNQIAQFFLQILQDEPRLRGLYVNRVKLSPDGSTCFVFFHTQGGLADFEEKRPLLVMYKPSLRTAIAKVLHSKYVPNLRFKYDEAFDKQRKVEELIDKLKDEGKL